MDVFLAAVVAPGTALAIDGRPFRAVVGKRLEPVVAVFRDAAGRSSTADFTATIDWGDFAGPKRATVQSRGGGRFAVVGAWTYVAPGQATVEVTVTDRRGRTVRTARTVRIAAAPLRATPLVARARAGVRSRLVLGRLTDDVAATEDGFRAAISWGDGTRSAGALVDRGEFFELAGVHRYGRPGTYRVVVVVTERAGPRTATARTVVRVRS